MTVLWIGMVAWMVFLVVVALALAFSVWLSPFTERGRLDREVQDASWRIHREAARAFEEMLSAARTVQRDGDS